MKKEILGSVLALTAGLALQAPQYSLADSQIKIVEAQFGAKFRLKLDAPARMKNNDGAYSYGFIYLSLEQSPLLPENNNELKGEMQGTLVFETLDSGRPYSYGLVGDDGEVLIDRTHRSEHGNIYQVYGCNSTLTSCTGEKLQLHIDQKTVSMDIEISSRLGVEFEETFSHYDENKVWVESKRWVTESYTVPMVEVK